MAGILGPECFLCGKRQRDLQPCDHTFAPEGDPMLTVALPVHAACLRGRKVRYVIREYQRRVGDLAGVRRFD